jgi:hypothetical protein
VSSGEGSIGVRAPAAVLFAFHTLLAFLTLLDLLAVKPAVAAPLETHGYLKTQLSYHLFREGDLAALDGRSLLDAFEDARLELETRPGRWDLVGHLQVVAVVGDSPRLLRDPRLSGFAADFLGLPVVSDPRAWLDLDRTVSETGSRLLVTRLDRLSVGYTGDHLVLRLGRQALTWGDGLVFQVLDLFNPFPPNAADTEYKPGTDMLSGQWLFASGDDLQVLAVPRRAPDGGPVEASSSSLAVQWHHLAGGSEIALLAARHFDDTVLGGGLTGDVLGGVWRLDVTYTRLAGGGGPVISAVANLDHSWVWRGKNVYGFAEIYRNGFGATRLAGGLPEASAALLARLERGEVFTLGRDEIAVGARLELTPLTTLEPTLLANARDGSGLGLVQLRRDLADDLRLDAGVQIPWGGRGTEYGGLAVLPAPADGPFLAPGGWLWVRLSRYF